MDGANLFWSIKRASLLLFHKVILFITNHPTGAPEVCMARTATAVKLGLSPKRVKESFYGSILSTSLFYMVFIIKGLVILS